MHVDAGLKHFPVAICLLTAAALAGIGIDAWCWFLLVGVVLS
jgi:hypothetical protein